MASLWYPTTHTVLDYGAYASTIGVAMQFAVAGSISAIRFEKIAGDDVTHYGRIYDGVTGTLLASCTFSGETASGWQTQALGSPLSVTAGKVLQICIYGNPWRGNYEDWPGLNSAVVNGDITGLATASYTYGNAHYIEADARPTTSLGGTLVFIDVDFAAGGSGYTLTIDSASVTITPTAITLSRSIVMAVEAASVAITPAAVELVRSLVLPVASAAVSVTPTDVALARSLVLVVASASVAVTPTDITLTYTTSVGYTLTIDSATVTLTPTDVTFVRSLVLGVTAASVIVTPTAINLVRGNGTTRTNATLYRSDRITQWWPHGRPMMVRDNKGIGAEDGDVLTILTDPSSELQYLIVSQDRGATWTEIGPPGGARVAHNSIHSIVQTSDGNLHIAYISFAYAPSGVGYARATLTRDANGHVTGWASAVKDCTLPSAMLFGYNDSRLGVVPIIDGNGVERLLFTLQYDDSSGGYMAVCCVSTNATPSTSATSWNSLAGTNNAATVVSNSTQYANYRYTLMAAQNRLTKDLYFVHGGIVDEEGYPKVSAPTRYLRGTVSGGTWTLGSFTVIGDVEGGVASLLHCIYATAESVWVNWHRASTGIQFVRIDSSGVAHADAVPSPWQPVANPVEVCTGGVFDVSDDDTQIIAWQHTHYPSRQSYWFEWDGSTWVQTVDPRAATDAPQYMALGGIYRWLGAGFGLPVMVSWMNFVNAAYLGSDVYPDPTVYTLAIDAASVSLSTIEVTLARSLVLPVAAASITVTPTAIALTRSLVLGVSSAAIQVTAPDVTLARSLVLSVVSVGVALSPQSVGLVRSLVLSVEAAAIVVTPQEVALTLSISGVYTLSILPASISVSGQSIGLQRSLVLPVDSSPIEIGLSSVALTRTLVLLAEAAAVSVEASSIGLQASRVLEVLPASVALTGHDVELWHVYELPIDSVAVELTSSEVSLAASRLLMIASTAIALTPSNVTLLYTPFIAAVPESRTMHISDRIWRRSL